MARRAKVRTVLMTGVVAAAAAAYAQVDFFRGDGYFAPRFPPAVRADRAFSFCRLLYTSVRREPAGGGWRTDYPYGEINLMIRLSELTKTPVPFEGDRQPTHYVVRLTSEALFECPFTMASDVGTIGLSPAEAEQLRVYLLKGGFLWVDDFWGTRAWEHWTRELAKVLPPVDYPIEDVPLSDPIFSSQFVVTDIPQITNIGFWRRTGGRETSERGADSREAHFRAIRDDHGRIMVAMTHNTDVADSWEREGEDPGFFYQFSPDGYALGINVLLYAMTH
ncbi:MAG: DUF4159 domain-containing protein [Acidobacteria bacterium]|nr:DUF4159 domain-containing protein [Acidobacteriota bacterium]